MASTTSVDDRKFAVFSSESVQVYGESIGVTDLPETVLQQLSEDASYRVRELVSKSCEFMRHSRRKNMKFTDVKRAIQWSNIHPVLGSDNSLNFNSSENIYFLDDPVLDLKKVVLSESKVSKPHPIELSTLWLTNKGFTSSQKRDMETEERMDVDNLSIPKSDEFTVCYSSIVECILSDNEILFQEVLKDLKTNPRIGQLVPYLVNFVTGANAISHDLGKLSMMLFLIKALLSNKYISLELYLKPLLSSVMYCVLEPLAASINPLNDHWLLRDYGSFLVTLITCSYPNQSDALLDHVSSSLVDILSDPTRPLCSHYGAMMTISMLSVNIIKKLLLPILYTYITTFLQPLIEDFSTTSSHMKEDAHKVFGAVVRCVEKLMHQEMSGKLIESCFMSNKISISEIFGDALLVRVCHFQRKEFSDESRSDPSNLHSPSRTYGMFPRVINRTGRSSRKWSPAQVFNLSKRLQNYGNIRINYHKPLPVKSRLNRPQQSIAVKRTTFHHYIVCRKNIDHCKTTNLNPSLLSWL